MNNNISVNWIEKSLEKLEIKIKELEKENKQMDSRVTTFLVAVMNGKKAEEAIKISGVDELTTNEILTEIAGVWNKNLLEAIVNFQNWVSTSDKLLNALHTLKNNNDSIRELDDALLNIKTEK